LHVVTISLQEGDEAGCLSAAALAHAPDTFGHHSKIQVLGRELVLLGRVNSQGVEIVSLIIALRALHAGTPLRANIALRGALFTGLYSWLELY
jgi:hypothetical protein